MDRFDHGVAGGHFRQMTGSVNWFTPLPPARNGIADYSAMLLAEMVRIVPCACYSQEPLPELPEGVESRDPAQSFRHLGPQSPVLHQIGNNGGHIFVLEALRRHGGVVSLHDLSLLYLYELASPRLESILHHMQNPARELGDLYARHWKEHGVKTAANYILFDMVGEVLKLSRGVIVHSEYARRKLAAIHGAQAAAKIAVIPHFAPKLKVSDYGEARAALGIAPEEILILTSGFATKVKRFDWLVDALHKLREQGRTFRWIHAGEERPSEYDLGAAIAAHPGLGEVSTITGYIAEDMLDTHIAAADIVVNLRFPSVGESSGTLARAFSAGRCCIVNDTAAYAEIPRDIAVHIPVFDTVEALVRALAGLIDSPELRRTFGERARLFAQTTLSLPSVARRYLDVIEASYAEPAVTSPDAASPRTPTRIAVEIDGTVPPLPALFSRSPGPFELVLWFSSADQFAAEALRQPAFLRKALGPHLAVDSVRFVAREPRPNIKAAYIPTLATPTGGEAAIGLVISGTVHA